MDPKQIPSSLTVAVELGELAADGKKLTATDRKELLRALRAGDVFTLSLTATSFLQPKAPMPLPKSRRKLANYNFVRFREEELPAFARSFKGRLFMRNHDRSSMQAVGGTILESEAVDQGEVIAFRQRLELVKPWAIEDALDGTMKTFSIGWDPKKPGWEGYKASLFCSVCDGPLLGKDACAHWPGDEINVEGLDEAVIVEALWVNVLGAETSEVPFPAVRGTAVDEIHAALSAARLFEPSDHREEPNRMSKAIAAALMLAATATEDDILGGINALRAETKAARDELAVERAAHELTRTSLETLRTETVKAAEERRTGEIAALREGALSKGLFIKDSDGDKLFQELAEGDIERAKRYLATLKPVVPVERKLRSVEPAPVELKKGSKAVLTESQRKRNAEMGVSDETFLKYWESGDLADAPNVDEEE